MEVRAGLQDFEEAVQQREWYLCAPYFGKILDEIILENIKEHLNLVDRKQADFHSEVSGTDHITATLGLRE